MAREECTAASLPVIATCERCGRGFLTLPQDGRDHYGVKRYRNRDYVPCGGRVIPSVDIKS
jgi:hypothetical protein